MPDRISVEQKVNIAQWMEEWKQQQASGLSRHKWCDLHNIPYSTFRYHIAAIKSAVFENTDFEDQLDEIQPTAEELLPLPNINLTQVHLESNKSECINESCNSPDIRINIREISVDINNTADREHMAYVLGVLLNVK